MNKLICGIVGCMLLYLPIARAQTFSREQCKEDITYFLQEAERIHPNLYANVSREQIQQHTNRIVSGLKENNDYADFYLQMTQLGALFRDGHTRVAFAPKLGDYVVRMFVPFEVAFENNQLLVKITYKDSLNIRAGDEITAINGLPAADFMRRAMDLIALETDGGKRTAVEHSLGTYIRLVHYPAGKTAIFALRRGGQEHLVEVPFYEKSMRPARKLYSFQLINQVGYLDIPAFNGYSMKSYTTFLDSVFRVMAEQNVQSLVVDIRGGGGGNSNFGNKLMSYVAPGRPFYFAAQYEIKTSKTLKKNSRRSFFRWYMYPLYPLAFFYKTGRAMLTKKSGSITQMKTGKYLPKPAVNAFNGNLYVLSSAYTYSAHSDFMVMLLNSGRPVTLIGEQQGQPREGFIDICKFQLPHTKMGIDVSFKRYVYAVAEEQLKPAHILPAVSYKIVQENDRVLQYTLQLIATGKRAD